MKFLSKIVAPFKSAWNAIITRIRDPKFRAGMESAVREVVDLFALAEPVVRMLAAATPSSIDDVTVEIASRISVDIRKVLALPKEERGDYVRDVAREVLRVRVLENVIAGHAVEINGIKIASAEQVAKLSTSLLNRAVEMAYGAIKNAARLEEPAAPEATPEAIPEPAPAEPQA